MANQFDAKVRFDPVAWRAYDKETGAVLTVIDNGGHDVSWFLRLPDLDRIGEAQGKAKNPSAARAKARRALAKVPALRKAAGL